MKKISTLFVAILLALSLTCGALAAGVTFTTKYFTLDLPENWIVDTEKLEDLSEQGIELLGYFSGPKDIDLTVSACLIYYDDLKDISLWNAGEQDIEAYKDSILEDFADEQPEFLEIITVNNVPFVLVRCTDEDGTYVYADTITNGYSIQFQVYLADEENFHPITDEAIEQFKTILATFKPVG